MQDAGATESTLIYFVDDSAINIDAAQVTQIQTATAFKKMLC